MHKEQATKIERERDKMEEELAKAKEKSSTDNAKVEEILQAAENARKEGERMHLSSPRGGDQGNESAKGAR